MLDVHAAQQILAGGGDGHVLTVVLQQNAEPARRLRGRYRIPELAGQPCYFGRIVYLCMPYFCV
jgi:hypothetical protein